MTICPFFLRQVSCRELNLLDERDHPRSEKNPLKRKLVGNKDSSTIRRRVSQRRVGNPSGIQFSLKSLEFRGTRAARKPQEITGEEISKKHNTILQNPSQACLQ